MIVVLCPTYRDCVDAFEMFETYLFEEELPWSVITKIDRNALLIQTDEDLNYIFIHHRFRDLFDEDKDDIVEFEDFFQNLEFVYNERHM